MSATEACVAHVGARRPPWQHDRVERLARMGHWYWPAAAKCVSWSQEAARIHGRETAREGMPLDALIADFSETDGARLLQALGAALETGARFELEARLSLPCGTARHIRLTGESDRDPAGQPVGVLVVVQEILGSVAACSSRARKADLAAPVEIPRVREKLLETILKLQVANARVEDTLAELRRTNADLAVSSSQMARAQAGIRYAALHDTVTGLPNRRYLEEKLSACLEASRRDGTSLAALHVDLDRFKQINDTLGHGAGDAVLRHVASVLLHSVSAADFVARAGSDEFVLLCVDAEPKAVETLARQLIAELERPLAVEGRECWFGASIGIALTRGDTRSDGAAGERLLVNAAIALHRAKKQGGCHAFFSADMQREIVRYKATADGVLAGLKRAEFVPFYQPQISADSAEIVGVEALARWNHPVEGVLPPARFLQVADDLGVAAALDQAILERAVADLRRWQAAGLRVPRLSVNVSSRRLLDPDLIRSLGDLELPRGVLSFELLESVFLDEIDDTISWNIDMLKEIGIEIELDDFGSGHASIVGLVKLGPNAIKIDRELVTSITADPARSALVQSIVDICRSLRTRVIAEGVETGAQAELLHSLGCDALQGYHFAKPMAADEFERFVERWQSPPKGAVGQGG